MLYVDLPSLSELKVLHETRADACISIYLKTTPITQNVNASRIELGNLIKQARKQLEEVHFDKRRLSDLIEYFDALSQDDEFWTYQANGLALLATPDKIRIFRTANQFESSVEVSDRFYLVPLFRSITLPNSAFILALSENAVNLYEIHHNQPPVEVKVEGLPKDAASSVGKSTLNDLSPSKRIQGLEGQNIRYHQYVRQVDMALRQTLRGQETPLILASTGRLADIFRTLNSYPHLLAESIAQSPDRLAPTDMIERVNEILKKNHQAQLQSIKARYKEKAGHLLATQDLATIARAATYGAIDILLVNIDALKPGLVDEKTGEITEANHSGASSYNIMDEIAGRAFVNGARVFGVRDSEIAEYGDLAAILRYPI